MKARSGPILALLMVIAFLGAACGGPPEVGSKDLLDFEEQKPKERLGEAASPTAPPAAARSPAAGSTAAPVTKPPEPPRQEERFFDVKMVAQAPYFEPGEQLTMSMSFTLRVTNNDTTAERPTRSFTAEDNSFNSGPLKPGQVWTYKFKSRGTFSVVDSNAPFIRATLEVR